MKLRNFANRLLLVALLLVIGWGTATVDWVAPLSTVVAAESQAAEKTYLFDQYNLNAQGEDGVSLYTDLGVVDYNQYLSTVGTDEVIVAVVDTGLDYTQPVFGDNGDRVLKNYAVDFSQGIPTTNGSNTWYQDHNGHGTHVAGVIADLTPANVKILPIKIFCGFDNDGSKYAFENAVRYLCALKGGIEVPLIGESGRVAGYCNPDKRQIDIAAVNLSLGTEGFYAKSSSDMEDFEKTKAGFQNVIDNLLRFEILPIVAAGNGRPGESTYYSLPGACDGVVAVSAYDNTDDDYTLAWFSFHNEYISVAAPGVEIWSACSSDLYNEIQALDTRVYRKVIEYDANGAYEAYYESGKNDPSWAIRQIDATTWYFRSNGTSMATPFVTACYALLLSDRSKTTAADYGLVDWGMNDEDAYYLTYAHKALLAAAATYGDEWVPGYDEYFGYGVLTLYGFDSDVVEPLGKITYETTPGTTEGKPSWEGTANSDEVDWFYVCLILLVGVILIWAINLFKAYCNRRKANDSEQQ